MSWSQTLKHQDYVVLKQIRLKNTGLQREYSWDVYCQRPPLESGSSWAIRVMLGKKAEVLIGIINRRKAEKFGFCFREEGSWMTLMKDLCLIHFQAGLRLKMKQVK